MKTVKRKYIRFLKYNPDGFQSDLFINYTKFRNINTSLGETKVICKTNYNYNNNKTNRNRTI